jgi:hypothetical protein
LTVLSLDNPVGPPGNGLAATLRPGNVHSADGWEEVLLPVIDRYQARKQTVVVRADATAWTCLRVLALSPKRINEEAEVAAGRPVASHPDTR